MYRKQIEYFEWVPSKIDPDNVTFLTGSLNGEDYFNVGYYHKKHGLVLYSTTYQKTLNVNALQQALKELRKSDRY